MSIFKRGTVYWYHFYFNGQHIQKSTKQGNPRVARQMEAAHRTSLAKGEVGIREQKPVVQFISKEFMPWASATFKAKRNTFVWYRGGSRRLSEFEAIATARLDRITGEKVAAYVAHRQTAGLNTTAVNRELQILRRMLHLAVEWGRVEKAVKIRMLPGEPRRERVLTAEESVRYLAAAGEPLASVTTVLIDSGLRPEECFRLRWEYIDFENGRFGSMLVPHGKTPSARRVVPLTPRVRAVLEARWIKGTKARGGLGLPVCYQEWACRTVNTARPAQERAKAEWSSSVCALHTTSHVPDAPGPVWMRRLDFVPHCGPLDHWHLSPIRASERGHSTKRNGTPTTGVRYPTSRDATCTPGLKASVADTVARSRIRWACIGASRAAHHRFEDHPTVVRFGACAFAFPG